MPRPWSNWWTRTLLPWTIRCKAVWQRRSAQMLRAGRLGRPFGRHQRPGFIDYPAPIALLPSKHPAGCRYPRAAYAVARPCAIRSAPGCQPSTAPGCPCPQPVVAVPVAPGARARRRRHCGCSPARSLHQNRPAWSSNPPGNLAPAPWVTVAGRHNMSLCAALCQRCIPFGSRSP